MYSHHVSGLSTVKSTFSYGYGFSSHVEAYWIAKKIECYHDSNKWYAYHVDFKDCFGEGAEEEIAIEELLIALDDGVR